jgi:biopolymer transport protein ExbD
LIFFIWTSSFEIPEFDLPSAVAEATAQQAAVGKIQTTDQPPPVEPFDEIVIRLSRADALLIVELNDQQLDSLEALKNRLSEIIAIGVQPPVVIEPAAEITMNVAVATYDTARAAGADRVLFAARLN